MAFPSARLWCFFACWDVVWLEDLFFFFEAYVLFDQFLTDPVGPSLTTNEVIWPLWVSHFGWFCGQLSGNPDLARYHKSSLFLHGDFRRLKIDQLFQFSEIFH